jgi:hypothetical protein
MAASTEVPATSTIHCEDCGSTYETIRKNTKYCAICRLFRDVMFVGTKKSKCLICEKKYCKTSRNDLVCADCDVVGSRLHGHGDCALCGATEAKLIRIGVAVCVGCAQDPDQRQTFIKALGRKVAQRKEAHDG